MGDAKKMAISNKKWDLISKEDFENYSRAQNTEEDIAKFCHVSINTLDKWCKETYGTGFKQANATFRINGIMSLRKKLYLKGSEGNVPCLIFALKNWGGMSDNPQRANPSVELANNTFQALQQAADERVLARTKAMENNMKKLESKKDKGE